MLDPERSLICTLELIEIFSLPRSISIEFEDELLPELLELLIFRLTNVLPLRELFESEPWGLGLE